MISICFEGNDRGCLRTLDGHLQMFVWKQYFQELFFDSGHVLKITDKAVVNEYNFCKILNSHPLYLLLPSF